MSKIRNSARGESCTVRIPGVCNHNPETVVFAHVNGAGMGVKASDLHGAYCCAACHDIADGRARLPEVTADTVKLWFLQGVLRTQLKLIEKGLVKL